MAKAAVVEIVNKELSEHPAAVAWCRVAPECRHPLRITVLKNRGGSRVYRLAGAGPGGADIVAKRGNPGGAEIERTVYEDIFPALGITALHFYGCLRENGESAKGPTCWIFMEDAGGEDYSYALDAHRALAGGWLGVLHSSAALSSAAASLPDRGPGYYLEMLRTVRETVYRSLVHPALNVEDRRAFKAMIAQYDAVESRWNQIADFCERLPRTLVHGDLAAKNVRVRVHEDGLSLVIMDWETAYWGTPAVDLAQFAAHSVSPDLIAYSSAAVSYLGDGTDLRHLAEIGNVFRYIAAANWATHRLSSPWAEHSVRRLRLYQAAMTTCLRDFGWGIW